MLQPQKSGLAFCFLTIQHILEGISAGTAPDGQKSMEMLMRTVVCRL